MTAIRLFSSHEADQIRSLEGIPLASFRARALAFTFDLALVLAACIAVDLPAALRERALGYGAPALEGGFGFPRYFIHPNRRTVHDRIAETVVVREPKAPPER